MYSLLHVYYRTNRVHDKTGGSRAGPTAGWEKARRGGRTKYDGIVKAWGFMCLVFSFGLVWFSLFVQCLGNSPTMGKSLTNPFIAAKLSVLKPFFNCWKSWAELNCKESGLLEPILKIEALETGFFILMWPAKSFNNGLGILFRLPLKERKKQTNTIVMSLFWSFACKGW